MGEWHGVLAPNELGWVGPEVMVDGPSLPFSPVPLQPVSSLPPSVPPYARTQGPTPPIHHTTRYQQSHHCYTRYVNRPNEIATQPATRPTTLLFTHLSAPFFSVFKRPTGKPTTCDSAPTLAPSIHPFIGISSHPVSQPLLVSAASRNTG